MTDYKQQSRERGSAMLEFALSVITLTFLFTGTFQYGYSFYVYNNLQTSIRSAARFASIQPYPTADFVSKTKNVAVYGKVAPNADDPPVAPGLDATKVNVNTVMGLNGAPAYVEVSVTGYVLSSLMGNWSLNGKPVATFIYMGHYQP